MLLDHHVTYTYSRNIQDWVERHPTRVIDRRNPSATEPPFRSESIRIRWTGSGVDIRSYKRLSDAEGTPEVTERKVRRPPSNAQTNTVENSFQPLQVCPPRNRRAQVRNRISRKIICRKINTSATEETDNSDLDYKHRIKRRARRENDRIS